MKESAKIYLVYFNDTSEEKIDAYEEDIPPYDILDWLHIEQNCFIKHAKGVAFTELGNWIFITLTNTMNWTFLNII